MNIEAKPAAAARIAGDQEALSVAAAIAADFAAGASARDRDRLLPWPQVEAFSRSGLWAITVPRDHGGAEVSNVTLARVVALISAADPSLGQIPQNHYANLERLRLYGSPEQKAFFFGRVLAGERFGNASAEPGDKRPKDHATRLLREGDGWRLIGRKVYATGALFAHWIPVPAISEGGEGVTVYVPRHAEGVTVIDDWDGFGQRTTASGSVIFDNVEIDPLWVAMRSAGPARIDTTNAVSQLVHVAIDLGIARSALDETLRLLRAVSHPARGSGVAHATQDPLALRDVGSLTVHYHAAEALTEKAARLTDEASASSRESDAAEALIAIAEAKILTTEYALEASSKLFELAGTQATSSRYNLDRHWRNARTHTLHDGVRWKYHSVGEFVLNRRLCDPWTLGHPYSSAPE
ncbi:SfnB family sulfur acquisition oxidoreductase [Bosea sp. Root381]|uniref:SfnB family sulfur acquisition oxidoreductase n=1 Tax=Bosea sp. Root381 TaxID=1736524 RepID=UPI0006F5AD66|nr:SfnB family sulfur acquisition oxidoreductase [Bosea sp. Root381]KRE06911.1 SfnB family sulfur acquisition oxidoreductase [Bosea sp. Root381]